MIPPPLRSWLKIDQRVDLTEERFSRFLGVNYIEKNTVDFDMHVTLISRIVCLA
ncbi:hypothetical protein VCR4J5_1220041 [Vibrio crassostreae]|uniref:Uncharacterized protein n=1 Tax=Vibrio crassostreae TaxID=246167 RepID=A0A822MXF1_9VIBR|nr:hypothetical protein VCR19J5_1170035 [Vibrio crassostreae]CDS95424.1 hypothetical protein VCR4J5_1220041 [Vibrio crassostreae]CDT11601.1 hypothetical protein VCR5J5_1450131 [Vibrio crassostreae]CDT12174.1 hypothetical protein VCR9J2_1560041 [Vibrio crassostreae]CDT39065.1 hypothetical protein VCR15J5_590041 [Vibrio crassostreae]